jgi:hypothetical protein
LPWAQPNDADAVNAALWPAGALDRADPPGYAIVSTCNSVIKRTKRTELIK